MRTLLYGCIIALATANAASATDADFETRFEEQVTKHYLATESELRAMMDDAEKALQGQNKLKIEKGIPLSTPESLEQGRDAIKMLAYNKAIIAMRCLYEMKQNSPQPADSLDRNYQSCKERLQAEMAKFTKLSDYTVAMDKNKVLLCEMRARDFASERRFPPFDFLKTPGGPQAFDFRIWNECLLSDR